MSLNKLLSKIAATTLLAVGMSGSAMAADYPEKPISLVIPLGAGGSHDLNARVMTSVIPQYSWCFRPERD